MRTIATRPSERAPKASLAKTGSLVGWTGIAATAQAIEHGAGIGPGQQRLADVDLGELGAGVDRPPDLARAVEQRQARAITLAPLAQGRRGLDLWVREAGQDRRGGQHRGHDAPPGVRAKAPSSARRPSGVIELEVARLEAGRRPAESAGRRRRRVARNRAPGCER